MTADILELTGGTKKRVDEIIKGDKPSMLIITAYLKIFEDFLL